MASRGESRGWASGPYPLRNLLMVANRGAREGERVETGRRLGAASWFGTGDWSCAAESSDVKSFLHRPGHSTQCERFKKSPLIIARLRGHA